MLEPLDMRVTRIEEILGEIPLELKDFLDSHEMSKEWWERAVKVIWYVVGL